MYFISFKMEKKENRLRQSFSEGFSASEKDVSIDENPYPPRSEFALAWELGFLEEEGPSYVIKHSFPEEELS